MAEQQVPLASLRNHDGRLQDGTELGESIVCDIAR